MKNKRLAIVSDHAGFYLKEKLLKYLIGEKYEVRDMGTDSDENVDYPDFGHPLANVVCSGEYDLGISICGTGNGINMVVNKHPVSGAHYAGMKRSAGLPGRTTMRTYVPCPEGSFQSLRLILL